MLKNKEKIFKAIYLADYVPDVMEKIEESLLDDVSKDDDKEGVEIELYTLRVKKLSKLFSINE